MNVTLSIDDALVARARKIAEARGTSLQQMIRDYLEGVTGTSARHAALRDLERHWAEGPLGYSDGTGFSREETYEERLGRYPKL